VWQPTFTNFLGSWLRESVIKYHYHFGGHSKKQHICMVKFSWRKPMNYYKSAPEVWHGKCHESCKVGLFKKPLQKWASNLTPTYKFPKRMANWCYFTLLFVGCHYMSLHGGVACQALGEALSARSPATSRSPSRGDGLRTLSTASRRSGASSSRCRFLSQEVCLLAMWVGVPFLWVFSTGFFWWWLLKISLGGCWSGFTTPFRTILFCFVF